MNPNEHFDVIILGCGPAGLQAAVHAARKKVSVAVLGKIEKSSLRKAHVENFCCMDSTVNGLELLQQGRNQAARFGSRFFTEDVIDIVRLENEDFQVALESGTFLQTRAIVLAMGIARNRLNVPGEKELLGRGVSYCVDCDGMFFKDQPVAVIGNESAAASGALSMLMIAGEVHLIYRELAVSEPLQEQVSKSMVIKHPGDWIKAVKGAGEVEEVLLESGETIPVKGVFIELGAKGALELAAKLGVALDLETARYIAVSRRQETNIPGIYAAGDICGPPWQVAKSVGEGCVAGLEAADYARKHPPA